MAATPAEKGIFLIRWLAAPPWLRPGRKETVWGRVGTGSKRDSLGRAGRESHLWNIQYVRGSTAEFLRRGATGHILYRWSCGWFLFSSAGCLLSGSVGGPFPQSFYTRMRKIPVSVSGRGGFIRVACGIFMRRAPAMFGACLWVPGATSHNHN